MALELGGKSASVILDDADLATAVKGTVNGCYLNSGQTCTALTRMLVPDSLYQDAARIAAEVAKSFTVGDPLAETTRLGPLSSQAQLERVRGYIRKGLQEGAELLAGGLGDGGRWCLNCHQGLVVEKSTTKRAGLARVKVRSQPGAAMPMTVKTTPLRRRVLPTASSAPPKRLCHVP